MALTKEEQRYIFQNPNCPKSAELAAKVAAKVETYNKIEFEHATIKEDEKKKIGRPTKYTDDLADEICFNIATSSEGIYAICRRNPHFPVPQNIYIWLRIYPSFRDKYMQAKIDQVDAMIESIKDISAEDANDLLVNHSGDQVANTARLQRDKLKIDTYKWLASKLVPKLYGDRADFKAKLEIKTHENFLEKLK